MGLLPADTKLPEKTPKRKRGRPPKKKPRKPTLDLTIDEDAIVSPRTATSRKKKKQQQYSDDDNDDDEEEEESMEPPTNPETALDPNQSHLTTVHWDPNSGPGNKIGWKIRVNDDKAADWKEGRVVFYDPCTHKHKIESHQQSQESTPGRALTHRLLTASTPRGSTVRCWLCPTPPRTPSRHHRMSVAFLVDPR